jgi:hypothetical protein
MSSLIATRARKTPTKIRKNFWGSLSKNFFAKKAATNDIGMQRIREYRKLDSSRVPPQIYCETRVTSIKNAINPDVKMYTSLGRLNAVRKAPRTAPPTPKKPAHNPDRAPPQTAVPEFLGNAHCLLRNKNPT